MRNDDGGRLVKVFRLLQQEVHSISIHYLMRSGPTLLFWAAVISTRPHDAPGSSMRCIMNGITIHVANGEVPP